MAKDKEQKSEVYRVSENKELPLPDSLKTNTAG